MGCRRLCCRSSSVTTCKFDFFTFLVLTIGARPIGLAPIVYNAIVDFASAITGTAGIAAVATFAVQAMDSLFLNITFGFGQECLAAELMPLIRWFIGCRVFFILRCAIETVAGSFCTHRTRNGMNGRSGANRWFLWLDE